MLNNEPPAPAAGNGAATRSAVTPQTGTIVFSRIVRATVGQIIEIPFIGIGWIYMGELASRRGIVYSSTRRDPEGQSVIFGAEEAGTYVLRFFKENFISGSIMNDYVQVIVGEASSTGGTGWFAPPYDRGRVVAMPRWPSALDVGQLEAQSGYPIVNVEELMPAVTGASSSPQETTLSQSAAPSQGTSSPGTAPSQNASSQSAASSQGTSSPGTAPSQNASSQSAAPSQGTSSQGTVSVSSAAAPNEILRKAGEAFTGGNVAAAVALLDQYREYYPNGTDEMYWMYGQFYEANSQSRNILLSLDYYRRLTNEFPQSSRFNDARRRIAYLERFYINIQ